MKQLLIIATILLAISACKKEDTKQPVPVTKLIVQNAAGDAQPAATVTIYTTEQDLKNDTNQVNLLTTGTDGSVLLDNNTTDTLIAKAELNRQTSEYTVTTCTPEVTGINRTFRITVNDPTRQQLLCAHGSKKWYMAGYTLNGSFTPYPVTSTLNSDGTWTDSNNRSGSWAFANNQTQLSYDYFGSGMNIAFNIDEFDKTHILLSLNMQGYNVLLEMVAVD